jgi:hypothetical protein
VNAHSHSACRFTLGKLFISVGKPYFSRGLRQLAQAGLQNHVNTKKQLVSFASSPEITYLSGKSK